MQNHEGCEYLTQLLLKCGYDPSNVAWQSKKFTRYSYGMINGGSKDPALIDFWSTLIANSLGLILPGLLEAILNKSIAETTVWIHRTPRLEACTTHLGQTPLHLAVVDDQILDLGTVDIMLMLRTASDTLPLSTQLGWDEVMQY